jgi:phytanoyl-CoA hydroxylase
MAQLSETPHVRNDSGIMVDHGSEEHDPSLYATSDFAKPVNGWEAITDEHYDFYEQEGYLAIEHAFTSEEVEAAKQGLLDLIMGKRPDFDGIMFEAKASARLDELSPDERQDAVRKLMTFCEFDSGLKALVEHPKLLAVVERILGEASTCFQEMALLKPPHLGREKPWHQDKAYFKYPVETKVVGVWIALDEATVANGCMHIRPQGHREGPILHFKRRDWQICDTEVMGKACVAVPLKPGGVLIFDGLLPHGTPTNHSDKRRKALQYHYAGKSAEKTDEAYRLSMFGTEGKDVEC